jgi:glycosyltransferase involved in cell wall biosynthesis
LKDLNANVDVLTCFNGFPYLPRGGPIKGFNGLKIYHLMDYTFFPAKSSEILSKAGVDFVFGYNCHDKYCPLFQENYPQYLGKVIPVPFGFADRFQELVPFQKRKNKVIALGSVNSFVDPVHTQDEFKEVNQFFLNRGEKFMHKFRRMLVENESRLSDIMDSKLPHFPKAKDFDYDIVEIFNQYKMFVSCESLQYFPPAKTFEGPASGSVLICSEHPCFFDYGFKDQVNCIKHKEFDVDDFRDKASFYISNPDKLLQIQKQGTQFVRENYNHKKIAQYVYSKISDIINKG